MKREEHFIIYIPLSFCIKWKNDLFSLSFIITKRGWTFACEMTLCRVSTRVISIGWGIDGRCVGGCGGRSPPNEMVNVGAPVNNHRGHVQISSRDRAA